jgi:hypothetical protein
MLYPLPTGEMIAHNALVASLAKPGDDILNSLTGSKCEAWHHASCIPGEVGELFSALLNHAVTGELDRENVVEELGDIEFYLQGLRAVTGIERVETLTMASIVVSLSSDCYLNLPATAGDVFDATKKWVIYNKSFDVQALILALEAFEAVLEAVRQHHDISYAESVAGNIMKLGTRYSSMSYSDQQAQDRADKAGTVH